jgi:hypothetical protein
VIAEKRRIKYGASLFATLRNFRLLTYTVMGVDQTNKAIIKKIGNKLKDVTGPPPQDLPERMKELLEQLKRK